MNGAFPARYSADAIAVAGFEPPLQILVALPDRPIRPQEIAEPEHAFYLPVPADADMHLVRPHAVDVAPVEMMSRRQIPAANVSQ